MRKFFLDAECLVGHNIIRYDIPVVERLLDIKVEAKLIDTLALSWYLENGRAKHGLEAYGEEFGKEKVVIEDWENQSVEDYFSRCSRDVDINYELFNNQWKMLKNLYDGNEKRIYDILSYLSFKLNCAQKAEESRWKLDVVKCEEGLKMLEDKKESSTSELKEAMPDEKKTSKRKKPKVLLKKDGTLSKSGESWYQLLQDENLPQDHEEEVTYVSSHIPANPNSVKQVKDWLLSLGWVPESFSYTRNKDGDTNKVPQIRIDRNNEKILCPSVEKLLDKEPKLSLLADLGVLTHRISILKGYLSNVDSDGYIQALIQGFTNTLRFKHSVVLNLPKPDKPHGGLIRGVLIAPEGYELCGSDMSSLEDRTKQHYMWDYDPEYVKDMMSDDFDPHLDLCVVAGLLTQEQADKHKIKEEDYSYERGLGKTSNYACVYGAGGDKVALSAGIPKKEGKELVEKYWERNWAVKEIPKHIRTKICCDQEWLLNPVSNFWYPLRHRKDIFSTLNQGTGVYCFDMWVAFFMNERPQITGQMHDEVILTVKKGYRDEVTKLLKDSIGKVNRMLKLNRVLDIDVQFGESYKNIH